MSDYDRALHCYRRAYESRYGECPLELSSDEATALRDIVRIHGVQKTMDIVKTYLTMDGPGGKYPAFFAENGHTVLALKRNINAVHSRYLAGKYKKKGRIVGYTNGGIPVYEFS